MSTTGMIVCLDGSLVLEFLLSHPVIASVKIKEQIIVTALMRMVIPLICKRDLFSLSINGLTITKFVYDKNNISNYSV